MGQVGTCGQGQWKKDFAHNKQVNLEARKVVAICAKQAILIRLNGCSRLKICNVMTESLLLAILMLSDVSLLKLAQTVVVGVARDL